MRGEAGARTGGGRFSLGDIPFEDPLLEVVIEHHKAPLDVADLIHKPKIRLSLINLHQVSPLQLSRVSPQKHIVDPRSPGVIHQRPHTDLLEVSLLDISIGGIDESETGREATEGDCLSDSDELSAGWEDFELETVSVAVWADLETCQLEVGEALFDR